MYNISFFLIIARRIFICVENKFVKNNDLNMNHIKYIDMDHGNTVYLFSVGHLCHCSDYMLQSSMDFTSLQCLMLNKVISTYKHWTQPIKHINLSPDTNKGLSCHIQTGVLIVPIFLCDISALFIPGSNMRPLFWSSPYSDCVHIFKQV